MKLTFIFLLFSTLCFSQNKVYTTVQIDSIAQVNGRYFIGDGTVTSEKKINTKVTNMKDEFVSEKDEVVKGRGSSTTKGYLNYYNQEYYNKLTNNEKKKYNREKDSELVKADFFQIIYYENKSWEEINADFYYRDRALFFARFKYNTESGSMAFELTGAEIQNAEPIKNEFQLDIKAWITEKNNEILKNLKL